MATGFCFQGIMNQYDANIEDARIRIFHHRLHCEQCMIHYYVIHPKTPVGTYEHQHQFTVAGTCYKEKSLPLRLYCKAEPNDLATHCQPCHRAWQRKFEPDLTDDASSDRATSPLTDILALHNEQQETFWEWAYAPRTNTPNAQVLDGPRKREIADIYTSDDEEDFTAQPSTKFQRVDRNTK
jgi:hypothetical protein